MNPRHLAGPDRFARCWFRRTRALPSILVPGKLRAISLHPWPARSSAPLAWRPVASRRMTLIELTRSVAS